MKFLAVGLLFFTIFTFAPLEASAQFSAGGRVLVGTPCTNGAIYVKFLPSGGYLYPIVYQAGVTVAHLYNPLNLLKPGTQFLSKVSPKPWTCITPKGGVLKGLLMMTVGTSL